MYPDGWVMTLETVSGVSRAGWVSGRWEEVGREVGLCRSGRGLWLGWVLVGGGQVGERGTTVEVVSRRTLMSAPAAPSVGNGFVSGGMLMDVGGARVGEGYSHCGVVAVSVAVPPEVTAHCTSAFRLRDGELHFSGVRVYPSIAGGFSDTVVAVTGGTGVYAGARGEGTVSRAGGGEVGYRFVFVLSG